MATPLDNPVMRQRRSAQGFTLVETYPIVLVAILGILVAIVVGVPCKGIAAAAEARTGESMATITTAIDAYFDENQEHPKAVGATVDTRSAGLFADLLGCEASKLRLVALASDTAHDGRFYDGFEQAINYHDTGGAGGGPYLESAGRDGDYGTKDDNIRSDNM